MPLPEQLGPYRILRRLGRGGMGTVYAAESVLDEQPAAVKVLSVSLSHDEGFRERFEAEIESLRKLRHPNIVRLFGFGEQDGILFYAMELIQGRSLEEELAAGRRFDWQEVTGIAVQTCRALRHAHDRGIVHRDIKPGNLMLNGDQEVKLSDFGIAKLFGNTGMTADGGIIGTAEYMAPEQADGRPATDRTDLYSLGGVMYTLLARRPPFRAHTLPEMLQLQRYVEPDPVRRFAPDTPAELERIIAQLLAKEPDKRFANATVLSRRLEAMAHALATATPSTAAEALARSDEDIANAATMAAPENGGPVKPSGGTMQFLPGAPSKARSDADSAATIAGNASLSPDADQTFELAPSIVRQTTRVFKTVEEADEEEAEREREPTPHVFSWHTAALVMALLGVGVFIWYSLRPPSRDDLLARVAAAADSVDELSKVEPDIQNLLSNHRGALSAAEQAELENYQEEIELERMERKYDLSARAIHMAAGLTPIERAYIESIQTFRRNQSQGIVRLEALINLYGPQHDDSPATRRCLRLAERLLSQYRQQVQEVADDEMKMISRKLELAQRLRTTDPEQALKLYESLVTLYADKPYAAQAVEEARQLAAELALTIDPGHVPPDTTASRASATPATAESVP